MKLYSLRDTVTGSFAPPIQAVDDVAAQRMVVTYVKRDPSSVVSRYLRDYDLYHLADFDDIGGTFTGTSRRISSLYQIVMAYDAATQDVGGEA